MVEQNVHRDERCTVQKNIHGLEVEIKCNEKCKNRKNNYIFVTHNADCDVGTTNYIQKVNFGFSVFSARINTVSFSHRNNFYEIISSFESQIKIMVSFSYDTCKIFNNRGSSVPLFEVFFFCLPVMLHCLGNTSKINY